MFNLFANITSAVDQLSKTSGGQKMISDTKQKFAPVSDAFSSSQFAKTASPIVKKVSDTASKLGNVAYSATAKPIVKEIQYQKSLNDFYSPYKSEIEKIGITYDDLKDLPEQDRNNLISQLKTIGVSIPGMEEASKKASLKPGQDSSQRKGLYDNVSGTIMDVVGGAVSEIPNVAGNLASFAGKMSQYTPPSIIGTGIKSLATGRSYSDIQKENLEKFESLKGYGEQGKKIVQEAMPFDPNTRSAKVGETGTEIVASLAGPNKLGFIKPIGTAGKIIKTGIEGALAGAKYDVASKGTITPEGVTTGGVLGGAIGAAPSIIKGAKNIIPSSIKLPEGVEKNVGDILKKILPDRLTPSEITDLKSAGRIESGKGLLGTKNQIIPTKDEINIAKTVGPIIKDKATTTDSISAIRNAIKNEAESLKSAISIQNPIIPKKQVASHIKSAIDKISENPEMSLSENPKLVNKLIEKYKALLNEEGGTALGILKARQRFDSYVRQFRPKAFDAPTGSVYDTTIREIRNSANDLLDSIVTNKSARESLLKQNQMYKAIEMLSRNSDINTLGKILKNPLTRGVLGGAAGGIGVGVASNF